MDLEEKNNCSQNISKKDSKEGLVLINTGNGKGKTTAALGLALRAAGHNFKVLILQFIKAPYYRTGEAKIMEKLKHLIEMEQLGRGFIKFKNGKPELTKEQIDNAIESFKYAREKIYSSKYDMVILDEINNLIDYGLLKVEDVVDLIKNKPKKISIVLTGRNAHHKLVDIADTVTEMKEVKHASSKGIKARKGIEY